MAQWKIISDKQLIRDDQQPTVIEAEYLKADAFGQFLEFKDAEHKVVYVAACRAVVEVIRLR